MGWFRPRGADSRPAAVSVLAETDRQPVGSGVVLPERHVLTCAHVVNAALDRAEPLAPDHPGAVSLRLRVHGADDTVECVAELVGWVPPRTDGGGLGAFEWHGDLAVLRLAEALPPAIRPSSWHPMAERQRVRAWHGGAERGSYADAEVTECNGRFGYVDGLRDKLPIDSGYSGGPLWCREEDAVVGLVTAKLATPGGLHRAWGIPWQRVRSELDLAGLGHLLDRPEEAVRRHPAYAEFVELLAVPALDAEAREWCGREVARQCRLDHRADGAPSADELAGLVLTRPRALPALLETVHRADHVAADALLALGRASGLPHLLSPDEHDRLLGLLADLPAAAAARVPAAVRAALPLAVLPAALLNEAAGGGRQPVEALVEHLEGLHGDSSPAPDGAAVPGLLRAVEFLAAGCCPEPLGDAVRRWNDAVAGRLGVHPATLADRRRDAGAWSRADTPAPRVLVELHPLLREPAAGPEAAPRYRMRLWSDDGAGPRRVSDRDDLPRTAEQVAREVFAAIGSLRRPDPGVPRPVVELIVDRDALEAPVDSWGDADPRHVLPRVLGVEYPLVVNCPELRELNGEAMLADWRERWHHLDQEETLHVDDEVAASTMTLYGLLMERRLAARAHVAVAPPARTAAVQTCLAAGVPVVLWDRSEAPGAPGVRYAAGCVGRQLPEEVRLYRAKALQRPAEHAGRPVLAWADADRPLPALELADPADGDAGFDGEYQEDMP